MTVIYAVIDKRPSGAARNVLPELCLMFFQIDLVAVFCLIEKTDVHADAVRNEGHGVFMLEAVQPKPVFCNFDLVRIILDVPAEYILHGFKGFTHDLNILCVFSLDKRIPAL